MESFSLAKFSFKHSSSRASASSKLPWSSESTHQPTRNIAYCHFDGKQNYKSKTTYLWNQQQTQIRGWGRTHPLLSSGNSIFCMEKWNIPSYIVTNITVKNFHHKTHFQKYKDKLCKHFSGCFLFTKVLAWYECFRLQRSNCVKNFNNFPESIQKKKLKR